MPTNLQGFPKLQYGIGGVMNYFAIQEVVLDRIIIHHYADLNSSHAKLMEQDILQNSRFGFEFKKELLKKILNKNYVSDSKRNKRILSNLTRVQTIRNTLAHGALFSDSKDSNFQNHESADVEWQGRRQKAWPLILEFEQIRNVLLEDLSSIPGSNMNVEGNGIRLRS